MCGEWGPGGWRDKGTVQAARSGTPPFSIGSACSCSLLLSRKGNIFCSLSASQTRTLQTAQEDTDREETGTGEKGGSPASGRPGVTPKCTSSTRDPGEPVARRFQCFPGPWTESGLSRPPRTPTTWGQPSRAPSRCPPPVSSLRLRDSPLGASVGRQTQLLPDFDK